MNAPGPMGIRIRALDGLVRTNDHDPLLITPRLEAFKAKEKAVKEGDPLASLYANARLSELKALEVEELS